MAPDDDFDSDYLTLLPPHPMVLLVTNDQLSVDLQREHIDDLHKKANMLVFCVIVFYVLLFKQFMVSASASSASVCTVLAF